jgi:hypothetical protein
VNRLRKIKQNCIWYSKNKENQNLLINKLIV